MALNNYANLKATVADWMHRNDIKDAHVDDVIALTEADIWPLLEIRSMEARAISTAPTNERFMALPDGFLQMRRLKINATRGDCDVRYVTPEQMRINAASGMPVSFTVTSELEFDRVPDSAYEVEMQYYRQLTGLSDDNATNDVLTRFPKIYLYGCLAHVFEYTRDENRAQYYRTIFKDAVTVANKQDRKGRYGSSPRMRIEGVTP